ncbi:MAG: hypothetical protein GWM90_23350, partial [Gemmatimonadetes bacterium]|nr:hypothetical protein [Gemmatimonadota bacterium]NIU77777.1 hypothetical protein [Gammaproteobacteria bacterium]NIP81993.1 hypothetical protein [Gemmatimonadota bacterium]NIQ57608.1 hypothetical protein [Gemmatimonadota bacterium]NIX46908.1 hypothetical protein [Gemmatimonadota bacterium]
MRRTLWLLPLVLAPLLLGAQEHVAEAAEAGGHIRAEHFFLVLITILVVGKGLGEVAERI